MHDSALQDALAQNAKFGHELAARHHAITLRLTGHTAVSVDPPLPAETDFVTDEKYAAWLLQEEQRCTAALAAARVPMFRGFLRVSLNSISNIMQGAMRGKLALLFSCCAAAADCPLEAPFLKLWLHGNAGNPQYVTLASSAVIIAGCQDHFVRCEWTGLGWHCSSLGLGQAQ